MTFPSELWWREVFGHEYSLALSQFPDGDETDREVAGLIQMLALTPPQRIADVCCGYGRHLLQFAARGYSPVGVDISPMMLALARSHLADAGLRVPLVHADARELPFADQSLDVVMNLFNSFGYCASDEGNQRILNETARVLRRGGKLLLDTRNRPHQILFAPRRLPMRTADGGELILRCTYDQQTHRLISEWRRTDTGPVVHHASIRLYALEELDEMMAAAGLRRLAVYGDYEGTPFAGYQRQLLYVAQKPQ